MTLKSMVILLTLVLAEKKLSALASIDKSEAEKADFALTAELNAQDEQEQQKEDEYWASAVAF